MLNQSIANEVCNTPSSRLFTINNGELDSEETLLAGRDVPTKAVLHMYSPAIARLLNPDQPDITGAVLFHQISVRQKNRCTGAWLKGGRYAVRSLQQLSQDCPYLCKSAVARALRRMKLKLQEKFIVRRDFVRCWYSINADLLKVQKQDALICFNPADALLHRSTRTAVLVHHMTCAMRGPGNQMQDHQGNKYVRMSPSALSSSLGYSEDTITRCLRSLCRKGVLLRHLEHPLWYTFSSTAEDMTHSMFTGFDCNTTLRAANVHNADEKQEDLTIAA